VWRDDDFTIEGWRVDGVAEWEEADAGDSIPPRGVCGEVEENIPESSCACGDVLSKLGGTFIDLCNSE
jgi:hypothetical protein